MDPTSPYVRYDVGHAIATITLDSPHNRNALSRRLVAELDDHLRAAAGDQDVRAIVLTHTGRVFCAGADLKEQSAPGDSARPRLQLTDLLRLMIETPKPVLVRVDGAVRAGGLGLLGAGDVVVASSQSSFAFTEARLGLAPAIISLTTLGRLTERAASRYYLTGETLSAQQAAECGLITEAPSDLDASVAAVLEALRLCSPQGLAETKKLTTRHLLDRLNVDAAEMDALSRRLFASDEAREGMRAFIDKRPPRWAV